ncbi:MAG: sulfatase, partial [bacterium]
DFRHLDAAEGYDATDQALGIDRKDCVFGVIRDTRYKYVHFAALPPLFFDLQNNPDELQDLSGYPEYSGLLLEYAGKMLSWRMTSNEKSLTHLMVDLKGVVELE